MKLFVSYRRQDTGGRAGRLVDALVDRFGSRNVFHDVSAIAPGHDFRERVEAAIATSDVVLIVIGQDWLGADGPDGADDGRRIDHDDDFVRLEVSKALSLGIPVVPVLVDGAVLPTEDALPADMSEMLRRQAVTIRDLSWHQDIDDVIRRIKGEDRSTAPARRWPILTALGLLILVGVFVVVLVDREPSEDSSEEPVCDPTGDSWVPVELAAAPVGSFPDDDAHTIEFEVLEARIGGSGDDEVVVRLNVTNNTEDQPDAVVYYFYSPEIVALLVDGLRVEVSCFGPVTGDQTLDGGKRLESWIGFRTDVVQAGNTLRLELQFGTVDIGIAP